MSVDEHLRAAIQRLLDDEGEHWQLTQYVVIMGVERFGDGRVESTSWMWAPPGQADWMTTGLLESGAEMHADAEIEDD